MDPPLPGTPPWGGGTLRNVTDGDHRPLIARSMVLSPVRLASSSVLRVLGRRRQRTFALSLSTSLSAQLRMGGLPALGEDFAEIG